jgi:regulator of RNase E activity RraA
MGQGDRGVSLSLGGVAVSEGDFLAGDQNGVLVLDRAFNVL